VGDRVHDVGGRWERSEDAGEVAQAALHAGVRGCQGQPEGGNARLDLPQIFSARTFQPSRNRFCSSLAVKKTVKFDDQHTFSKHLG
jgi:hypothetical protein